MDHGGRLDARGGVVVQGGEHIVHHADLFARFQGRGIEERQERCEKNGEQPAAAGAAVLDGELTHATRGQCRVGLGLQGWTRAEAMFQGPD